MLQSVAAGPDWTYSNAGVSLKRVDGRLCRAAQWGSVLTVSQVSKRGRPCGVPRALFSIAFLLSLITSPLVSALPLKSVCAMKGMKAHFLPDSHQYQHLPCSSNLASLSTHSSWVERVQTPLCRDVKVGKEDFRRREDVRQFAAFQHSVTYWSGELKSGYFCL